MKKFTSTFLLTYLLCCSAALADPVKVIFDTDMGNDVDDALALAMLHSLQNRGESELLAITATKDHAEVAPYLDAINTFYGRPDIPIGTTDSGVTPEESLFTGLAFAREDDRLVYPHDLKLGDPSASAVDLLRETLAQQADQSVVIIQVGFSTNLVRLLDTVGDRHSALNGTELVAKKVKHISIMAGAFTDIGGDTHLEFNIVQDIPAARRLASDWPTPVIWSGFEVGLAIRYPAASIENDFAYVDRHPIPESYQAYIPTPHERPTWDLTSVLWAIRPDRNYFELSQAGQVEVKADGETVFQAQPNGLHRFLKITETEVARAREIMAALVSEPPRTLGSSLAN
jgi:inosine-uridine nucleoside N-ribohydrolase